MRRLSAALLALLLASCRHEATAVRSTTDATVEMPPKGAVGGGPRDETSKLRDRLVDRLVRSGFLTDRRVEDALRAVPRHLFVPEQSVEAAYEDRALPIGHGQTISQPTVVAIMSQALELHGTERVLEIGTGSGYQAAILSVLAKDVYSIELIEPLADEARERLDRLGYRVKVRAGDGYRGWPEAAPFDRIILTAAPPTLPKSLVDQLAEGGVLVAPVGTGLQELQRVRKTKGKLVTEILDYVLFVPMVPGK